ncbi:hypothetical protein ACLKA6_000601 [Drosophila palustris]
MSSKTCVLAAACLSTRQRQQRGWVVRTESPPRGSSNNSVDEPSDDDIVDVGIQPATSFAESTSSSAGNISPVVSSFGVDFVDTLIEEEDKSNLAATAAATIILPGAVIANSPSGAAAAAASSNSNEKDCQICQQHKVIIASCIWTSQPPFSQFQEKLRAEQQVQKQQLQQQQKHQEQPVIS